MSQIVEKNEEIAATATTPQQNERSSRSLQIAAWIAAVAFVLGWFTPIVGSCTGAISGAWFVRTQKPLRGFLWLMAFSLFFGILWHWRMNPLSDPLGAAKFLIWMVVSAAISILPNTLYRLVSPRLPGFVSTLSLPLAGAAVLAFTQPLHLRADLPASGVLLLFYWLAALVVWMWREEFRPLAIGAAFFVSLGLSLTVHFSGAANAIPINYTIGGVCFAGYLALAVWALANAGKRASWAQRPDAVARLRSPYTGDALKAIAKQGREELVSASGEHFAIRRGMPVFLRPEDLTGDNASTIISTKPSADSTTTCSASSVRSGALTATRTSSAICACSM